MIATLGVRAWSWLDRNVDAFTIGSSDDAATRAVRLRAFGELLLFLTAARRLGEPAPQARALASAARAWLPRYDWESHVLRDPGFVVALLTVVEFLDAEGADAAPYRRLVARELARGNPDRLALRPYRRLELDRLLVRARFVPHDTTTFARRAGEAFALLDMPPSLYATADCFALTHLAAYVTDDGARAAEAVLGIVRAARLRKLVGLVGRIALIDGDDDLAAECVLAERFLGGEDDAFARAAATHAATTQAVDGSWCAPDAAGTRLPFERRYHPTLLWAFASDVLLRGPVPLAA